MRAPMRLQLLHGEIGRLVLAGLKDCMVLLSGEVFNGSERRSCLVGTEIVKQVSHCV